MVVDLLMNRFNSIKYGVKSEQGFALIMFIAFMIFVSGLYTSVAFQVEKKQRWELNFALGQAFAEFAAAAHHYAQSVAYDPSHLRYADFAPEFDPSGPLITVADLTGSGFLPATFTVPRAYAGVIFQAYGEEIENAPATPDDNAITAYAVMALSVNSVNERKPADISAFYAGAADRGYFALSSPQSALLGVTGETCADSGNPAFLKWGDNDLACLEAAEIDGITDAPGFSGGMTEHWAFGAAWEAAYAQMDFDALMRYPQPNLPNFNIMTTDIEMNGRELEKLAFLEADSIDVSDGGTGSLEINPAGADNPDDTFGALNVAGSTILNSSLEVTGDLFLGADSELTGGDLNCTGSACSINIPQGGLSTLDLTLTDNLVVLNELDNFNGSGVTIIANSQFLMGNQISMTSSNFDQFEAPSITAPGITLDMTDPGFTNLIEVSNSTFAGGAQVNTLWDHGDDLNTIPSVSVNGEVTTLDPAGVTATDCFGDGCPDRVVITP